MLGLLCEVCGTATCKYERTSGVLECSRCHSDATAGRRPDPRRRVAVKAPTSRRPRRVA